MSTFYYIKDRPYLALQCDICGETLQTLRTGYEFPEHKTIDGRNAGWKYEKVGNDWKDYCPECVKALQQKKREAILNKL